jgi:hypothetical protein
MASRDQKSMRMRVNLISFPGENVFVLLYWLERALFEGPLSFAWTARAAIIVDVNTPGDDCECKSAHASDESADECVIISNH